MQLSLPELSYTHKSITEFEPAIRNDGRSIDQLRPLSGQVDVLPGTNGSARVKWASSVEIVIGVKAEVGDATPEGGKYVASVEMYVRYLEFVLTLFGVTNNMNQLKKAGMLTLFM